MDTTASTEEGWRAWEGKRVSVARGGERVRAGERGLEKRGRSRGGRSHRFHLLLGREYLHHPPCSMTSGQSVIFWFLRSMKLRSYAPLCGVPAARSVPPCAVSSERVLDVGSALL